MNTTATLREMHTGEIVRLPASTITSVKATILTRLRREFIAEKKDWKVGEQDPDTGEYYVVCIKKD